MARRTRESVLILEAAGYDVILIETVGVGQSETLVAQMTDMFVLLLLPGGGDELQGIKRGIMELAGLVIINKADGAQKVLAERDVAEFTHALRLMKQRREQWKVPVVGCSSLKSSGIDRVWDKISAFFQVHSESGALEQQRRDQRSAWFLDEIHLGLMDALNADSELQAVLVETRLRVAAGDLAPTSAANQIVAAFLNSKR